MGKETCQSEFKRLLDNLNSWREESNRQFSDIIEEKGGVDQLVVTEMMEWFMRSVMDLLVAIDSVAIDTNKLELGQRWPTYQILKKLFVEIVKPIEQLVIDLFPLPPYKTMR